MINFRDVSFSYGENRILENFNFTLDDGGRVCLFAPSGYGKTTLLRLMMGLEKPQKGSVSGTDGKKFSAVFQEDRLLPNKTVLENAALFGNEDQARDILSGIGLADALELYPFQLSGGMSRRAAIARALNREANIYIFDEPFTGIDDGNIAKTADIICRKTAGKTFILVSHSRTEANLLKTEIIELDVKPI